MTGILLTPLVRGRRLTAPAAERNPAFSRLTRRLLYFRCPTSELPCFLTESFFPRRFASTGTRSRSLLWPSAPHRRVALLPSCSCSAWVGLCCPRTRGNGIRSERCICKRGGLRGTCCCNRRRLSLFPYSALRPRLDAHSSPAPGASERRRFARVLAFLQSCGCPLGL
jgi:hypothetical protein